MKKRKLLAPENIMICSIDEVFMNVIYYFTAINARSDVAKRGLEREKKIQKTSLSITKKAPSSRFIPPENGATAKLRIFQIGGHKAQWSNRRR